jgi:hypothetical protein
VNLKEVTRWTRYSPKRVGIYAPPELVAEARAHVAAGAARREQQLERRQRRDAERFAARIRETFPRCPAATAAAIAGHACEIGSGRVGRSSTADDPVRAAVIAHIRHAYTDYDAIMDGEMIYDRESAADARDYARRAVRGVIAAVLVEWESGAVAVPPK